MRKAPNLQIEHWLNSDSPLTLESMLGRVVVVSAFQLLCPGCVAHGLPQAVRVYETFPREDVVVLGLHCVFEHHNAQGRRDVLSAFLHENRIPFPVGMDQPSSTGNIPETMSEYQLQGTPTTILIDREGYVQHQHFGQVGDMALGAQIMALQSRESKAE